MKKKLHPIMQGAAFLLFYSPNKALSSTCGIS